MMYSAHDTLFHKQQSWSCPNSSLQTYCSVTVREIQKRYGSLINFIHCKLSFSIIRSTIRCFRGTQSTFPCASSDHPIDIDVAILDAHAELHEPIVSVVSCLLEEV